MPPLNGAGPAIVRIWPAGLLHTKSSRFDFQPLPLYRPFACMYEPAALQGFMFNIAFVVKEGVSRAVIHNYHTVSPL